MATLFLIRHGEPEVNGVLLGQMDPTLSSLGKAQSANSLSHIQVEIAWTSPLRRAMETAASVQAKHAVVLQELQEWHQGEWTGLTWAEVEAGWGALAQRKLEDWFGTAAPGGETWDGFLHRVRQAWNRIHSGPFPCAVVAHLGVNAALKHLIDGSNPAAFTQQYCEVMQLDVD